ncbi:MAG: hypothetical protein LBE75_03600 [Burkholderiales bacterium]|nr:hypothetical protein [Burkholderiales bacterium]
MSGIIIDSELFPSACGAGSGGSLVKVGTGTLTLSGDNNPPSLFPPAPIFSTSPTAIMTVNAGTLKFGAAEALYRGVTLTVASGAALDLDVFRDVIVGTLIFANNATLKIDVGRLGVGDYDLIAATVGATVNLAQLISVMANTAPHLDYALELTNSGNTITLVITQKQQPPITATPIPVTGGGALAVLVMLLAAAGVRRARTRSRC